MDLPFTFSSDCKITLLFLIKTKRKGYISVLSVNFTGRRVSSTQGQKSSAFSSSSVDISTRHRAKGLKPLLIVADML